MGQHFHNSKDFLFIDVVVLFCGCECGQVVGYWVKCRFCLVCEGGGKVVTLLGEYGTYAIS